MKITYYNQSAFWFFNPFGDNSQQAHFEQLIRLKSFGKIYRTSSYISRMIAPKKHKSQVRIMRLLAKLGFKCYCESNGNFGRVYVEL